MLCFKIPTFMNNPPVTAPERHGLLLVGLIRLFAALQVLRLVTAEYNAKTFSIGVSG